MGLERTVSGCISLRGNLDEVKEAIAALRTEIDDPGCNLDLWTTTDGSEMQIDSYTTSGHTSEKIDTAIVAFASKWAREPATLESDCGGDREDWIVGPEGFDPVAAKLANLDGEIAALQAERALILKRR